MTATRYHHGSLREALIDAAVEVVRERGPEGLSLRELARQVGVSHNAAYRHFAHRDELMGVVAALTMQRLVETMQRRLDGVDVDVDDPVLRARRRLAETGRGYVDFVVTEPGLFRLAFAATSIDASQPEPGPYALLGRVLDDLVVVGFLSDQARVGAEMTCWSAMHGFAVLSVDGPLKGASPAELASSLEQVLRAIDRSYAASTGTAIGSDDLGPPLRWPRR